MNKSHLRALKLVAVVAAAPLVLTACGDSGSETAAAAAAEEQDNVFVVTLESDPPHFNMGITTDGSAQYPSRAMFEPLVNLNEQFEVVPGLATEWTANAESTEFTFTLREGVTWHDGEPFTSADVAFYFDEVMPTHPLSADIAAIYDETLTPDEHTAIVKLNAPYGPFFAAMTPHYLLPAHLYAGTDIAANPANLEPVGTGPFEFESYTSGDSVVVTKSDTYWGEQGDVDEIVYKIMPDGNSRATAFQSGEVDLALKLPIINMVGLENDDRFVFENAVMAEHLFMFFNTRNPSLQDPQVRQALFHAIDREEIAEKVYHGTAEPSRSIMPNQVEWAIDPSTDYTKTFDYDIDLANTMLDEAGMVRQADGTRFTVRLNFRNSNPTWGGAAELVKASFEKIGVNVDLISQETSVYGDAVFPKHDFDITLLQLGAFADPTLGTARAYLCNENDVAFRNPTGICDEELDAAFAGAASTSVEADRVEFFTAAAERNAELMGTAPLLSIKSMESFRGDKWDGIEGFTSLEKWDWSALVAK
jgi:peptide/nickel transport system substrate-binding protein